MNKLVSIEDLVKLYYESNDFDMLRDTTKSDYKYFLSVVCNSIGQQNTTGSHLRKLSGCMRTGLSVVSASLIM